MDALHAEIRGRLGRAPQGKLPVQRTLEFIFQDSTFYEWQSVGSQLLAISFRAIYPI